MVEDWDQQLQVLIIRRYWEEIFNLRVINQKREIELKTKDSSDGLVKSPKFNRGAFDKWPLRDINKKVQIIFCGVNVRADLSVNL